MSLFHDVGGLSWEDLKAGGDLMAGGWNLLEINSQSFFLPQENMLGIFFKCEAITIGLADGAGCGLAPPGVAGQNTTCGLPTGLELPHNTVAGLPGMCP